MKIILIFLFILIGMAMISVGMDLLMGLDGSSAFLNIFNPLWVITPFGFSLLTLLFLLTFLDPIILKKRKKR
ncbi:hypothetical protein [Thalassobacillus pellis]|uniref:hypothetical protein n=1 Tax=Thalassobacillus pellis TaxID=748008 RepID=UPI001961A5E0|nr:hypothetical protein [Thalassobacillus pellis]MBM7553348.1 hypothetical protein [Thalassobacillus pellis]